MTLVRHRKHGARRRWGCPHSRNRTNWCYRVCIPRGGIGTCGRTAPHALLGRTQQAILSTKSDEP